MSSIHKMVQQTLKSYSICCKGFRVHLNIFPKKRVHSRKNLCKPFFKIWVLFEKDDTSEGKNSMSEINKETPYDVLRENIL